MKILKAKVAGYPVNGDFSLRWTEEDKNGMFYAILSNDIRNLIEVFLTSPYFKAFMHGVFAPPAINSEILVVVDENASPLEYYYLSTILKYSEESEGFETPKVKNKKLPFVKNKKMFNVSGEPCGMAFQDSTGTGLEIIGKYEKTSPLERSVKIATSGGNKIKLSDSPDLDAIDIKNKHGDGILIMANKNPHFTGRSISIKSHSNQSCTVESGSYSVTVQDGTDINLTNNSLGTFSPALFNPLEDIGPVKVGSMFGNINLKSKHKDINIVANGLIPFLSNIYITSKFGLIQLKTNGEILINAAQKIVIQSNVGIDLLSTAGSININAPVGNVNILGKNINLQGTDTLNAEGLIETNIGAGTPVNLNRGGPVATSIPILPVVPLTTVYGD